MGSHLSSFRARLTGPMGSDQGDIAWINNDGKKFALLQPQLNPFDYPVDEGKLRAWDTVPVVSKLSKKTIPKRVKRAFPRMPRPEGSTEMPPAKRVCTADPILRSSREPQFAENNVRGIGFWDLLAAKVHTRNALFMDNVLPVKANSETPLSRNKRPRTSEQFDDVPPSHNPTMLADLQGLAEEHEFLRVGDLAQPLCKEMVRFQRRKMRLSDVTPLPMIPELPEPQSPGPIRSWQHKQGKEAKRDSQRWSPIRRRTKPAKTPLSHIRDLSTSIDSSPLEFSLLETTPVQESTSAANPPPATPVQDSATDNTLETPTPVCRLLFSPPNESLIAATRAAFPSKIECGATTDNDLRVFSCNDSVSGTPASGEAERHQSMHIKRSRARSQRRLSLASLAKIYASDEKDDELSSAEASNLPASEEATEPIGQHDASLASVATVNGGDDSSPASEIAPSSPPAHAVESNAPDSPIGEGATDPIGQHHASLASVATVNGGDDTSPASEIAPSSPATHTVESKAPNSPIDEGATDNILDEDVSYNAEVPPTTYILYEALNMMYEVSPPKAGDSCVLTSPPSEATETLHGDAPTKHHISSAPNSPNGDGAIDTFDEAIHDTLNQNAPTEPEDPPAPNSPATEGAMEAVYEDAHSKPQSALSSPISPVSEGASSSIEQHDASPASVETAHVSDSTSDSTLTTSNQESTEPSAPPSSPIKTDAISAATEKTPSTPPSPNMKPTGTPSSLEPLRQSPSLHRSGGTPAGPTFASPSCALEHDVPCEPREVQSEAPAESPNLAEAQEAAERAYLDKFLNRHKASKAARSAIQSNDLISVESPKPRVPLGKLDANSPSPVKTMVKGKAEDDTGRPLSARSPRPHVPHRDINGNAASPKKAAKRKANDDDDEDDDSDDDPNVVKPPLKRGRKGSALKATAVDEAPLRRSSRVRAKAQEKPASESNSKIPVRVGSTAFEGPAAGGETMEADLASVTRANTRRNKGKALSVPEVLARQKRNPNARRMQELKEIHDAKAARAGKVAKKGVRWGENKKVVYEAEDEEDGEVEEKAPAKKGARGKKAPSKKATEPKTETRKRAGEPKSLAGVKKPEAKRTMKTRAAGPVTPTKRQTRSATRRAEL